jgi:hypothetical protein
MQRILKIYSYLNPYRSPFSRLFPRCKGMLRTYIYPDHYASKTFGRIVLEIQNSKVNNVYTAIIIQKAITKSSTGQHGPPTNAKVGSDAAEEWASPADRSHLHKSWIVLHAWCFFNRAAFYWACLPLALKYIPVTHSTPYKALHVQSGGSKNRSYKERSFMRWAGVTRFQVSPRRSPWDGVPVFYTSPMWYFFLLLSVICW